MASRGARYDPRHDDPYMSKEAYPDPYTAENKDAFEYVGPDSFPDPPRHTFEDDGLRSPRNRSPPRKRNSQRASTLPPRSTDTASPPPRSRRAASPPVRSKRSDSPPRHRRSKHDASPPPVSTRQSPEVAASAGKGKQGRFANKPALKNMKTYGRKGLSTLGQVVDAYAAAQAPPADRGRPMGRDYPYGGGYYPEPEGDYLDPYDDRRSRHRRRHYSISPSPSPPRRRSDRHSDRRRPPMNGRQKSFSVSPAPRSKAHDYPSRRGSRRYSPSPSVSPAASRRRGRSHSHARDKDATPEPMSRRRASMNAARTHLKSPNPDVAHRWQLAARAALEAGGVAAFRLRNEPGSWAGEKGAKVATAAIGAAAIDAFIDKDPRRSKQGGMKGMAENAIGGMLASKLMGFKSATTHKGKPRW